MESEQIDFASMSREEALVQVDILLAEIGKRRSAYKQDEGVLRIVKERGSSVLVGLREAEKHYMVHRHDSGSAQSQPGYQT